MQKNYLAHISEDGKREQTVFEHLKGTAELAAGFAAKFGAGELGYLAGMAHDIGKYTDGFQRRLTGGPKVDHATAGAWECQKLGQFHAAFGIAGHHGGLPDGGSRGDRDTSTLMGRFQKAQSGKLEHYEEFQKEVTLKKVAWPSFCEKKEGIPFFALTQAFFIRMLYSCLVDADFLDTAYFMEGTTQAAVEEEKQEKEKIATLEEKLEKYCAGWFPPKTELNQLRCKILESCLLCGEQKEPGLFTLTVPTGGGKTIASLAFALRHAKTYGKRRIIYVIPYTSIIEQTAEVFRTVLGEENVLEHHSGMLYELEGEANEDNIRKARATENWDILVVVTTAVQFFESLYSNRPSKCRKLHNLAESVIIFDEAQMLPIPYLKPCIHAIAELVAHYGVSAVLCTATQPALTALFQTYLPGREARELCPAECRQNSLFRRVTVQKIGKRSWIELGEELNQKEQVLCIVNSRKNADTLFHLLQGEGVFHLSTLMYPEHRRRVLKEIRERLQQGKTCKVVATSLIEAGVDVDFPAVYREEAGLDSMLQAAGRCNREGKRPAKESIVTIFQAETPASPMFRITIGAAKATMQLYEDIAEEGAIQTYFKELLELKGEEEQDKKRILRGFEAGAFPFQSAAEQFHLIETDAKTLYIPRGEGEKLIERLSHGERSKKLFRELGQYSVSVYPEHLNALYEAGDVKQMDQELMVLTNPNLYTEETGLSLEADFGKALFV